MKMFLKIRAYRNPLSVAAVTALIALPDPNLNQWQHNKPIICLTRKSWNESES